jgi:hypothetical protein
MQDIVNNLLNGLRLVHLEAEGHVPAEMLELVDRTIQEAAVKLKALGDLERSQKKKWASARERLSRLDVLKRGFPS